MKFSLRRPSLRTWLWLIGVQQIPKWRQQPLTNFLLFYVRPHPRATTHLPGEFTDEEAVELKKLLRQSWPRINTRIQPALDLN
jgi:hypothetical protein